MAKVLHPMSSDFEAPRTMEELKQAQTIFGRVGRGDTVSRVLAELAVFCGLAFLVAMPATCTRFGDLSESRVAKSAVTPAAAVSSAGPEFGNGPTGYFPDQFVVKHWDESPLPPQF